MCWNQNRWQFVEAKRDTNQKPRLVIRTIESRVGSSTVDDGRKEFVKVSRRQLLSPTLCAIIMQESRKNRPSLNKKNTAYYNFLASKWCHLDMLNVKVFEKQYLLSSKEERVVRRSNVRGAVIVTEYGGVTVKHCGQWIKGIWLYGSDVSFFEVQ